MSGLCAVEYRHQQCVRSPGHHGDHVWLMPEEVERHSGHLDFAAKPGEPSNTVYYVLRLPQFRDSA